MDAPEKSFPDLLGVLKSWIPWRSEPGNVSRDFWMPDQSCMVCYECDSQFTLINRRHHCRHCGRVFCAKCTANWIPAPSSEARIVRDEWEKIRVCNFCFKQWEQGLATVDNGIQVASLGLSTSPSATSILSTKSSGTIDSSCITFASMPHSVESYQQNNASLLNPRESEAMETNVDGEGVVASKRSNDHTDMPNPSPNQFEFCMNRSDDDDDEFGVLRLDSKTRHFHQTNGYYAEVEFDEIHNGYSSHKVHPDGETIDTKSVRSSSLHNSFNSVGSEGIQQLVKKEGEHDIGDECEAPSSLYPTADVDAEPVDFENNGLLWLPPEPEDEEDEREALLFDDDDEGVATGEWGYLRSSSSFGSGEHRNRDRSNEEHKKAMKNVVDGHFRALVAQLLQVENLPVGEEDDNESWLEIITSLSWEAATLLKPDMSKGGGMDPGGYVKVKCLASGRRSESMAIKGVVCKKNVAHRRMTSRIEKPRLLILGGALEYQRVSNHLSSFDTLLQQEMDHLKMAVAKIDAYQPDVLLVEKSVSRFAQEYLLGKDISLVLNIKRPLLERIARCTGSQIVPSIDHLSSQKLGYCDLFHVERFLEEHGTAGQGGKKLVKTLMYFEGCPKPLGCTILLRGASGDELKKVKHVIQYGVFAAYHLALETSFLADEGASLPELPLNSPLTVALPDKPSSIDRSISTIPGFTVPANERTEGPQPCAGPQRFNSIPASDLVSSIPSGSFCKVDTALLPSLPSQYSKPTSSFVNSTGPAAPSGQGVASSCHSESLSYLVSQEKSMMLSTGPSEAKTSAANGGRYFIGDKLFAAGRDLLADNAQNDSHTASVNQLGISDASSLQQEVNLHEEQGSSKEEFPPSPSDHQSILVSLSSRCVWTGTVCERSHLFRIKYYGNFDKPLGRFLRDHLFDQVTLSLTPFGFTYFIFGKMVACFRYASIHVHSVYLPPPKLDFKYENQDWIQKDLSEVVDRAELFFSEVLNALSQMVDSSGPHNNGTKLSKSRRQIAELEAMLQKEKTEFEESLQKIVRREVKKGQPGIDILEINRLRRQLLFQSYMWDHRLIYAASLNSNSLQDDLSLNSNSLHNLENVEKSLMAYSTPVDMNMPVKPPEVISSSNPVLVDVKLNESHDQGGGIGSHASQLIHKGIDTQVDSKHGNENQANLSSGVDSSVEVDHLEAQKVVRRTVSEGQFPVMASLSDTLDAAWTGENHPGIGGPKSDSSALPESFVADYSTELAVAEKLELEDHRDDQYGTKVSNSPPVLSTKGFDSMEDSVSWLGMPFINFYRSLNKNFLGGSQKLDTLGEYKPVYVSSFRELELQGGARLLLPVGANDTVIPVYDDEPTSIISYALVSSDYFYQLSDEYEKPKDTGESTIPLQSVDSVAFQSFASFDEMTLESYRSLGSTDESILSRSGSRSSLALDPVSYTKSLHVRVSFSDDGPLGKVKYTVTCYYAKRFDALRRICCPSEMDFVRSLSRCKKWGAQGGKSNVFFAKTLDDRFIIKQVTKTELESFIKFAPGYFKYLSESIGTGSPTCLAKILGIYQVTSKHLKGGKESKMDVLIPVEVIKVLLDQNLIEAMPTSPIFVGNKAKRLLERAVWNDTSFLASIDVMDYSLLVGIDEEKHELVLGIIDFMRQYTWDKHLETWVKASGILGGPKNISPTVISPKQYKKRFRKAMTTYFLMVPDQWSPPTIIPSKSQTDLCEENNTQSGTSVD
ncbi:phosphatidylinositol-4-phosphate 5-kinase family protein [Actinidia rufa]|uniref:1-phosphatidylinositol-3-phosphate 5-kinase n=1 Tax=Actinidia rufa TaxID=165716 RepID=A0A7J0G088_9ERIC|nr:phosphatidylinositol-4-phosphate 5-kinase family protein [Actinidia rufa]